MTDPRDPLVGLDPYPRDMIDTLGLYPERAELLEDIVSLPGPARSASTRTRALLAAGIAAAVVIIGGVWFAASNGGGGNDAPVAAASSIPTAPVSSTATGTTPPPATGSPSTGAPSKERCRRLLGRGAQLRSLESLLKEHPRAANGKLRDYYIRVKDGKRRIVVFGRGCTVRELRGLSATGD